MHFVKSCSPNCDLRNAQLKADYEAMRTKYVGLPYSDDHAFDVELVDKIITELKRNKAAGLDYLTAEHLQFSHPIVLSVMCTLFNIMMSYGYVPASFGRSYTIPLPKGNAILSKALMVDDFRGISISPVLSKIFEHCILDRFSSFLATTDNQLGFKKGLNCSHAIYSIRSVIGEYAAGGSTVNICSLDLSKVFDLFIKLMNRNTPVNLLAICR